jgi:beta-glucosidase
MPRHEHWGRVYEGYGEHPAFTSEVAHAAVSAFQQFNGATYDGVAATAKHFLGDGASIGGVSGADTPITASELEERFLPPYQAAIDAKVAAVMVGFNSVNGVAMHQHGELIQDTLKNRLGFEGVVLTDWDGGLRYGPPETVINAGVDMAMQPGSHQEFIEKLESAILEKRVSMDRINDAVRRILRLKIKTGVFKRPYFAHDGQPAVGTSERRSVARQAVRESLVLLKSENSVLPLAENQTVYVVGEHADNAGLQSGGWSIHWQGQTESYRGATTILNGIKAMSDKVIHEPSQCDERSRGQTVVAVVGEQPYAEHLGDTDELWLPTAQKELLETCRLLANKLIVILISGRPLEVNREIELSDAFIAAWLPGSEGAGIADLLFAKDGFKPVGKLPHPWPKDLADLPLEIGDERALFPYGFGLQDF